MAAFGSEALGLVGSDPHSRTGRSQGRGAVEKRSIASGIPTGEEPWSKPPPPVKMCLKDR